MFPPLPPARRDLCPCSRPTVVVNKNITHFRPNNCAIWCGVKRELNVTDKLVRSVFIASGKCF